MDTGIIDTEISVTNTTKGYIELLASRIHRNMIRKLRSINSKSVQLLILTVSMVAVIFAAQQ
jgi:Asp/Glu/hydantoin racemase